MKAQVKLEPTMDMIIRQGSNLTGKIIQGQKQSFSIIKMIWQDS